MRHPFLHPEPPAQEEAASLFVDREKELALAVQRVSEAVRADPTQVLAVVGRARCGKSHFLRVLLDRVKDSFDVAIMVPVLPASPDAREILRRILNEVSTALHNQSLEKAFAESPDRPNPVEELDFALKVFAEVIRGDAAELTLEKAQTIQSTIKRSSGLAAKLAPKLPFLPTLGEIAASVGSESTTASSASGRQSIRVPAFDVTQLTTMVSYGHELMRLHDGAWKTLLVVDDFDLLKRNADLALDPLPLHTSLCELAAVPGFFVVTTVREDTYGLHEKTFFPVAKMKPFPDDRPLHEMYTIHVQRLNQGVDPFGGTFVSEAAKRSEGRPGAFLQFLSNARLEILSAGSSLKQVVEDRWHDLSMAYPKEAEILQRSVLEQGGLISPDQQEFILKSPFANLVMEDHSSHNDLRIRPIDLSVLREKFSAPRLESSGPPR